MTYVRIKRYPATSLVVALIALVSWTVLQVRPSSQLAPRPSTIPTANPSPPAPDRTTEARISEAYGQLPLSFEANQGRLDRRVKYFSRGSGYSLFLTATEAVFTLGKRQGMGEKGPLRPESRRRRDLSELAPHSETETHRPEAQNPDLERVLRMRFMGGNQQPQVVGLDPLPGKSNYFVGKDPSRWRTGIANYARVQYRGIYPGVDLVYYGRQRQLEYDLVLAPGADPEVIKLTFEGPEKVRVDEGGELVLQVGGMEMRQHGSVAYQEVGGVRKPVSARYRMKGERQVGFQVGPYDPDWPLIIDPVLSYSTYLGGGDIDHGLGIAVDGSGNAYVTGQTYSSPDFPVTAGAFQRRPLEVIGTPSWPS